MGSSHSSIQITIHVIDLKIIFNYDNGFSNHLLYNLTVTANLNEPWNVSASTLFENKFLKCLYLSKCTIDLQSLILKPVCRKWLEQMDNRKNIKKT